MSDADVVKWRERAERAGREVRGVLDALGGDALSVREGGGPEDIYASLACSVANLHRKLRIANGANDALGRLVRSKDNDRLAERARAEAAESVLAAAVREYGDPALETTRVYCRHVAQRLRELAAKPSSPDTHSPTLPKS